MDDPVAIILAAGKGMRMQSELAKVLHTVNGRPMIEYVLDAARGAGVRKIIVVVGHQAEKVKEALGHHGDVEFALQAEQKGTGHAVQMCADQLANHDGPVMVLSGDTPLLQSSSLAELLAIQRLHKAACVMGTAETDANEGLGRIVRDEKGQFLRIVEQRDATPGEAAIREINTGCYAFDSRALLEALNQLQPANKQSEYYLTDCAEILLQIGSRAPRDVSAVIAHCSFEITEAMGINTVEQLAEVEQVLQTAAR